MQPVMIIPTATSCMWHVFPPGTKFLTMWCLFGKPPNYYFWKEMQRVWSWKKKLMTASAIIWSSTKLRNRLICTRHKLGTLSWMWLTLPRIFWNIKFTMTAFLLRMSSGWTKDGTFLQLDLFLGSIRNFQSTCLLTMSLSRRKWFILGLLSCSNLYLGLPLLTKILQASPQSNLNLKVI